MILEILRFELREQLRSPLLWLVSGLFGLLAFALGSSEAVQIGGGLGNVHQNAPLVVARLFGLFSLFGLLVSAIFVSGALLRDFEQGTAELYFSTPLRRGHYLAGRLLAAMLACLLIYLLAAAGLFLAQFMPWIAPERLGPVSLAPYGWSFAIIVLPNLVLCTVMLALFASLSRSIMWVYLGVLAFLLLYLVTGVMMRDLDNTWLVTLSEPLGLRALSWTTRYWSAEERNTGLPALSGYLLANRALWLAVASGLAVALFASFRTERSGTRAGRGRRRAEPAGGPSGRAAGEVRPSRRVVRLAPAHGARTVGRQFLQQLRFDMKGVFRSVPFLVMLAFAMINFIGAALNQGDMYGTPLLPVTSQMLAALQGSFSWMLIIIVLFHAGELVWKERAARIHEVSDAMPVPDWMPLAAKFCTLVLVVVSFQAAGAIVSIGIQALDGRVGFEPLVYVKSLSLDSLVYILMGGMALCLQVLANNKFAGYALLILVLVVQATLGMLDYTHHLYTFGSWPNAPYSDMNGYGHFLVGQLAFEGYWLLFMAILLLVSTAMWVRGSDTAWARRLARGRERMRGGLAWATALAMLAFVAWGGVLFWNTNVRNTFIAPDRQLDLQARYETELGGFRDLPQPRILAASTEIDLRPETQALHVRGRYRIVNPHDAPLDEIHVAMDEDETLASIDLGGATLVRHEQELGYRIYRLDAAMQPGEVRDVDFVVDRVPRGITNDVAQHEVVENGSFFNNRLFPAFGYQAGVEIMDRHERRKRGLGEARRMNRLEDDAARANNYVDDDADWIDFKTTICTAPDQTALAPGYLTQRFERDGRACFSYEMDRPMLNYYAFLSGRWEVTEGRYKDIPIEVYHHPGHAFNVQRMIEAARKSLAYYEDAFTPYQHRQLRILEFPGYETFAQSFANTIPYSERIGFIADLGDPEAIDYVFYVTAHEVAHQWWAHQVIGGDVQGATVLSESLSQYSALMVMEHEYGRAKMRRFLKHELDSYLSDRAGERLEELPLYRVENQPYIHYRKGALVFYRLREEIGEAALNRALKRFLQDKGYQSPPYTTSAELVDYIRAEAPASADTLVTDLFEKISFYDNRVDAATARLRDDGKYEVTLSLHAAKRYADGVGKETAGTLDDWIEVAVFGEGEGDGERVLYLQRLHVTSSNPTVTVVVDGKPVEAGFDPYNKLIDRVSSDNRKRVSL